MSLYFYKDCVEGCGNHLRSKCCSYQAFPNHRQCRMRAACTTPLLKSVELASQRKILHPFMTYCYFVLECSLQFLLLIPGLALACERGEVGAQLHEGVMEDVHDGNIWKEFQVYGDRPFLSNPFAFGLMMNIDWFQPYKHLIHLV